jgi:hypothetical protein
MKTATMKPGLWLIAGLIVSLCLAGCPQKKQDKDSGKITLGLGLDKGKAYTYEMNGTITIKQSMNGNEQTLPEMKMKMTQHMAVAKDKSPDFHVKARLEGFSMDIPGLPDEIKKKMDELYAAMNGAEFSFAVTPKGEIKSFKGLKEYMARLGKTMQGDPMSAQMFKSLEQYINDEQLMKQMGILYNFGAGARKLSPGETWAAKFDMPMVGADKPLALKIKYKLDQVKTVEGAKTAILTFDSKQSYGEEGMPFMEELMKESATNMGVKVFLHEFNMDGRITMDLTNNRLKLAEPNSTIKLRVVISPPDQPTREVTQTVHSAVAMKLAK